MLLSTNLSLTPRLTYCPPVSLKPQLTHIYYFIGLAFWIASVLKLFYVADPVLTKAILNVCSGQGSAGLEGWMSGVRGTSHYNDLRQDWRTTYSVLSALFRMFLAFVKDLSG